MSEVLNKWPKTSHGAKYPWDLWLDGRIHRIEHGTDYTCVYDALRVALYRSAKNRGVKVKTSYNREDQSITVQAYGHEPNMPPATFGADGTVERAEVPPKKKAAGKK